MKYLTFFDPEPSSYEICFLVPELNKQEMFRHYVTPYFGTMEHTVLAYDLVRTGKKTSVSTQKEYLADLLPMLSDLGVTHLVVSDADYFKTLTKLPKAEAYMGYVLPCVLGNFKVTFCPDFRRVFYDPVKIKADIELSLTAVRSSLQGVYTDPGQSIIHSAQYPQTVSEIAACLDMLLMQNQPLTADIEAFSLKHFDAGIGTISFAWSKHEGIAFPVDLHPEGPAIRALLKDFFLRFQPTLIWHNVSYDVYVLIYQLFMDHILDRKGMLFGMRTLLRNWDCTKLITYLATNSCAGNKLSLKAQAQEFAGNYAVEEIKNIRNVPLDKLLQYNLVDALSTWFVYEKHVETLIKDNQVSVYKDLFQPAILDIIQMQLTGLPLDRDEVLRLQAELQTYSDDARARMNQLQIIQEFVYEQTRDAWEKDYEDRRGKAKNPDKIKRKDFDVFPVKLFNPNSGDQLQSLLYADRWLGLPVLDLTDSKQPATGGETLEKLVNHTQNQDIKDFLAALIDFKSVDKILTGFIPAFLEAPQAPDGHHYLFGNFNLGGTVSGRLSSSDPNLQNLPSSGTRWGKAVKRCFKAPKGWLFVGLDFNSLEDRISALTTRDRNKLKVYTDGYDGHSLRAQAYFGDQMPDIDPRSVDSINSIQKLYKPLRQESKTPTFLLTYGGTWRGMIEQLGWSEEKAKAIEAKYHELYKESDDWVAAKIHEAEQVGYVTVAFGLRVRTPILHQVILGNRATPFEAEAEARTAGNALGQSWCLLNSRAASEFMTKVRNSEYAELINPCAHIHDSQYYLIPDDIGILDWVNTHLVKAVEWQDHPDIWHDQVKLGGELTVFWPTWKEEMIIPNQASLEQILTIAKEHYHENV